MSNAPCQCPVKHLRIRLEASALVKVQKPIKLFLNVQLAPSLEHARERGKDIELGPARGAVSSQALTLTPLARSLLGLPCQPLNGVGDTLPVLKRAFGD